MNTSMKSTPLFLSWSRGFWGKRLIGQGTESTKTSTFVHTKRTKFKNRSGNANTCKLTHLCWRCFWSQRHGWEQRPRNSFRPIIWSIPRCLGRLGRTIKRHRSALQCGVQEIARANTNCANGASEQSTKNTEQLHWYFEVCEGTVDSLWGGTRINQDISVLLKKTVIFLFKKWVC